MDALEALEEEDGIYGPSEEDPAVATSGQEAGMGYCVIYLCIHAYIHTYIHTYIHASVYVSIYIYTYTYMF